MTDRLTPFVEQAMREAARVAIMPRFGTTGAQILADKTDRTHGKCTGSDPGSEPVTAADRESEEILAQHLARLIPGAGIVGEEAVHSDPSLLDRLVSDTCWLIDPLDGTANFAAGQGPFGILVSLLEDGVPIGGWILDPLGDRFCAAVAGKGASINCEPFYAASLARPRPLVAITRLFADRTARDALIRALEVNYDVVDSPRCAADQYPRVATGGNDLTLFTRTLPWDHAAGIAFLNEAGGHAARPDGTPYRCDDRSGGLIAATCPRQWDSMATRLAALGYDLASASVTA